MADSALAVLGRGLRHALVVTADVILLTALSVAANPSATCVAATSTAGGTAHSVAARLPATTTLVAAAAFAFSATLFIAARPCAAATIAICLSGGTANAIGTDFS